jgi:nucleotide-binding universal stress UspA family protein
VGEITHCARQIKADLIVAGHKHLEDGRPLVAGALLKTLIEQSPCSVLVVITH